MVGVIIRHWVGLMVGNEVGPDGFGYTVAGNMTLFYTYYGLIDSTNLVWLQWGFDRLIGLFDRYFIINKVINMVTMVCQPVHIARKQSAAAYGWQMNEEGDSNLHQPPGA